MEEKELPEKPFDMLWFLSGHPEIRRMKNYKQHRNTDAYSHCRHVTLKSLWIIRRTGIQADLKAVIWGAMLHDFYLYDFSTEGISAWKHGREHPETALRNAERIFRLGWKEKILYTAICGPYISRIYHCAGKQ